MDFFSTADWLGIGLVIFIMGMSKGGFPVSGIALPLLVLLWPEQGKAARAAVSFMLPLLCIMDIVGALMYRKTADWTQIRKLLPGMGLGIIAASIFFVADQGIAVSDRLLKLVIGLLGLLFSGWYLAGRPLPKTLASKITGNRAGIFGFGAGFTSTIAHAAGPVMQMYLLPENLPKRVFAGTTVYFFLILNAAKLLPFALLGRFSTDQLFLNLRFLPVIPVGVLCGYALVQLMREKQYTWFIHVSLALTSTILIIKALLEFNNLHLL